MLSRSEPREEIEIATNKITTMFLYFGRSEPQRSYKHGSYKKKKRVFETLLLKKIGFFLNADATIAYLAVPLLFDYISHLFNARSTETLSFKNFISSVSFLLEGRKY